MITIDGVQYRNLEEQVKKNKDDIAYILEEEGVLNQFGIQVVGEVESSSDLPDPTTYEGEFGNAYAVGTTTPYELYIYTRANGDHPTNYWFNIGQFPLPGPMGPAGIKGDKGETGLPALEYSSHRTTSTVPIVGTAFGTAASNFNRIPVVGDYFLQIVLGLNGTSAEGRSWITNNEISSISGSLYNFRVRSVVETTGAQGQQGNKGDDGSPGPIGAQGPIGPQGNPGQSFVIAGTVANEGQLPDPSTVADNIAYLVGTQAPYDLYVQLQDSSEWFNAGIVEGVQGPMGPQGPMPPLVDTRGTSTTDAISQQGIENIFYNAKVTLGANSSAIGMNSIAIGAETIASGSRSTALGYNANSSGNLATALGFNATASSNLAIALGYNATSNATNSIQLGQGTLSTPNTFQVGNYPLLDLSTGLIPSDRLPDTTIPVANSTTLGGVMPVTKTDDMTQEVGVDSAGKLYTSPGSGGGGGSNIIFCKIVASTSGSISQFEIPSEVYNKRELRGIFNFYLYPQSTFYIPALTISYPYDSTYENGDVDTIYYLYTDENGEKYTIGISPNDTAENLKWFNVTWEGNEPSFTTSSTYNMVSTFIGEVIT